MSTREENIAIGFVIAVLAVIGILLFWQDSLDCDAKGGVLVRGVIGYECVDAKK